MKCIWAITVKQLNEHRLLISSGWCPQLHRCEPGLVLLRMTNEIHLPVAPSDLKGSTCVLLPYRLLLWLPWAEVFSQALLLPWCELRTPLVLSLFPADAKGGMYTIYLRVPFLEFCSQEGKCDLVQKYNYVAELGTVTISNSYFSNYSSTK